MKIKSNWYAILFLVLHSLIVNAQFCGSTVFMITKPSILYPNKAINVRTENVFVVVENRDSDAWAIRLQVSKDIIKYPFTISSGFICKENDWNYTDDVILYNRSDVFRQGKPQHIIPLNLPKSGAYFFTCRAGRSARNSAYAAPIKFNVELTNSRIEELLGEGDYLIQQLDSKKLFKLLGNQTGSNVPVDFSIEEKWAYYKEIVDESTLNTWFWFYSGQYYSERGYLDYGLWCFRRAAKISDARTNTRFNNNLTQALFQVKGLNSTDVSFNIAGEDNYRKALTLIEASLYDSADLVLEIYVNKVGDKDKLNAFYWMSYIAQQQDDLAKAEEWLLEGYELAQRIGNDNDVGSYAYHLGCFYRESSAILLSKEYLDAAILRFLPEGNSYALGQAYYQLGLLFFEQGSIDFSIDYLDNARVLAAFQGNLPLQISIYKQLVNNFFTLQNCEKAENYTAVLQSLEDSLQNVRNREIEFIANLRLAEETTLAAQLSEKEAKDELLNSLLLLLFFGIVIIFSIGVGIYLYKQGQRLKEKDQFLQAAYRREIDLNHLLKEVYSESIHRIRNYFSILGATINKELRRRKKTAVKYSSNKQYFLSHLQQKIFIFRNINEALSGISTQNLEILTINVIPILKTLQSDFQLNYPKIKFECTFIEYLEIDYRTVEIICLIAHEAIINATKHAFDEHTTNAVIDLRLTIESNNSIYLSIRDNGKGIAEKFNQNGGLKRIKTFVTLLNGTFTFHNKDGEGTEMIVRFVTTNR